MEWSSWFDLKPKNWNYTSDVVSGKFFEYPVITNIILVDGSIEFNTEAVFDQHQLNPLEGVWDYSQSVTNSFLTNTAELEGIEPIDNSLCDSINKIEWELS